MEGPVNLILLSFVPCATNVPPNTCIGFFVFAMSTTAPAPMVNVYPTGTVNACVKKYDVSSPWSTMSRVTVPERWTELYWLPVIWFPLCMNTVAKETTSGTKLSLNTVSRKSNVPPVTIKLLVLCVKCECCTVMSALSAVMPTVEWCRATWENIPFELALKTNPRAKSSIAVESSVATEEVKIILLSSAPTASTEPSTPISPSLSNVTVTPGSITSFAPDFTSTSFEITYGEFATLQTVSSVISDVIIVEAWSFTVGTQKTAHTNNERSKHFK